MATADSSNSYVTVAEADAYFDARLHASAWTSASTGDKNAALIWATRLIDSNVCFTGSPTSSSQPLAWPRTGMIGRNGGTVASDAIPQQLKDATCEMALLLLAGDPTAASQTAAIGLTGLKAGPVELKFSDSASLYSQTVPDPVLATLVPLWICEEEDESATPLVFAAV